MKKISMMLLLGSITTFSFGQDIDKILNVKEIERIERILSADDMQGRQIFTPGIDKAAAFIAGEFRKIGLQTPNNGGSYFQSFTMLRPTMISTLCSINGSPVDARNVMVITNKEDLKVNEQSGYEKVTIAPGANLRWESGKYITGKKNYLVLVDSSFARTFQRTLSRLKTDVYKSDCSAIFVLTSQNPKTYTIEAKHQFTEGKLANVVGVIPGKSKKNEYVIFGGHHDHLGIREVKDKDGKVLPDSVLNGANDNAAGTTAVIMLAKYFKELNNNERTLVFVTFTAEESGGYGANYFSRLYNPDDVKAMFNIEMIGTESKWGKNSAYITGYEKTDMGKILQGNLEGTGFNFYPDPYPAQDLFFRSDNATLAMQGVPAHTVSTAKMDMEPHYHRLSDEIGTLDMENMTKIMKAIALSSRGIISGKETPSRVDVSNLNRSR